MLLLSHRGYHEVAPENTIEAFAQAVRMNVDGIETDLRVTRDGRLILFHDRVVPDGREIADLTHAEIIAAVNYPVPTAEEAVAGFDGLLWNLEIKVAAAVSPALALVRKFMDSERRFLITSFWHTAIAETARQIQADAELAGRTNLECGLLTADRPLDLDGLVGATSVQAIVWYYDIIDEPLLAEARRRGIANHVYGVRTLADHRRAIELGLDGVITDHPPLLAAARLS